MNYKIKPAHINLTIEILFLAMMFLITVIFDRRIGIVFSGTKVVFIRMFVLLFLSLWAAKIFIFKEHRFVRTVFDWPVLTFLLICCAATLGSVHVYSSLLGFYGRYEGLITWLSFGLIFFIAINFLKGFQILKKVIAIVMLGATTMSIYGVIQRFNIDPYAWGGVATKDRVIATIGQPNFLAAYIIMAFMLVLGFLLWDQSPAMLQKAEAKPAKKNCSAKIVASSMSYAEWLPLAYYLIPIFLFIMTIFSMDGANPWLWYSSFILMTVSAVWFAYTYEKMPKFLLDTVCILSLALMYVCLFFTQSRGGFLGFLVGFILVLVLTPRSILLKNLKKLILLAMILVGLTGLIMTNPTFSFFHRYTSEINIQTSPQQKADSKIELSGAAGSRGETWKSGFKIIANYPIFGIGPEVLKMIFPRYETDLFRFNETFHVKQDRCHNETFDVAVTKGLFGFMVYWGLVAYVLIRAFKKNRVLPEKEKILSAVLIGAIASYIIQNQFSFGVVAIVLLFWIMWAMVAILGTTDEAPAKKESAISTLDLPWLPLAILLIVFLVVNYYSLFSSRSDYYFKAGKTFSDLGKFESALPNFNRSLQIAPYDGNTITHTIICLINSSQQQSDPAQKQALLQQAMRLIEFGIQVDPYNADNIHIASRIFMMMGNFPKAREYANQALLIDPYYAEAHIALAEICDREGKRTDAQKHYQKASQINPSLDEPRLKLGWQMILENRLAEALVLFQDLLVKSPQNSQVHNGLGAIYLKQGNKSRAREEFEQALALNPSDDYARQMLTWAK